MKKLVYSCYSSLNDLGRESEQNMLLKVFFAYLVVHLIILSSLKIDAFSVGLGGQFYKREGGKVSEKFVM